MDGSNRCRSHEEGVCVEGLRTGKEASVAGAEWWQMSREGAQEPGYGGLESRKGLWVSF